MSHAVALQLALVGSPNSGKTALFNRLTGARQKVANYAGVTVERKEGRFTLPDGRAARVLDLPGAYSLAAASPDERVTRDACLGLIAGEARPDIVVAVADATNLRLHLRFVLELKSLGLPMVLALNCADAAERRGIRIDLARLSAELGMPVAPTVAVKRHGAQALLDLLVASPLALPAPEPQPEPAAAPRLAPRPDEALHEHVHAILDACVTMPQRTAPVDDALDRVLLHPVLGLAILAGVMFLMFQAVFAWAAPLQDGLESAVLALGGWVGGLLPEGLLQSLIVDGLFAGVGSVLVFLPQILMLFLFILALEESGYLPRAAFLLDRFMVGAGLSGRSFIPLLSSFACAVPGIMATRSIPDPRDRLATMLVAPLMTCSARLPVYTLLIGAFIPRQDVLGVFNLQGLTLFTLYVAGIASALVVSWLMARRGGARGEQPLLLELPSYRLPHLRDLALGLWERAVVFLKRVGTIILSLTVLLWALSSFPAPPADATGPAIDYSVAGWLGRGLQVIFEPLGFNWQISIALVPGLAAREVAVSALATVYALSETGEEAATAALTPILAGGWSLATGLSLLVWYIYAPMCISTLAVIKRESNSWRPVWLAAGYLFGVAYLASFATYQIARTLLA
jgi:ferrous iron transport protein B